VLSIVIIAIMLYYGLNTGISHGSAAGVGHGLGRAAVDSLSRPPIGFALLLLQLIADLVRRASSASTRPSDWRNTDGSASSWRIWSRSSPLVLFSGVSVAIGLLIVSAGFLMIFDGMRSLELMPEILFGKLDNFALLSIPMFIIMGASIASTRAGADLYEALERWLTACPAALWCPTWAPARCSRPCPAQPRDLCGHRQDGHPRDAQARLSRRGRGRLHRRGWHAGHPDPALGHHDRLRHRHRNLDRAAVPGWRDPGLLLVGLFMAWSLYSTWRSGDEGPQRGSYTWRRSSRSCRASCPSSRSSSACSTPCMAASRRRRKRRPWARCSAW
jgi:hypothetical protein